MAGGGADDDDVVEVSCGGRGGGDPCAYAAVLKRKLDLYCAAVAKSMEAKSQESLLGYPNSQASDTSQLISQASFDGDIDGAGLVTNSNVIEDDDFQGKPANSGTSKELSDDDGDLEETTDPANANKMRRMLSNRESARRSRKRKQAHLNDLESQVSRLTSENASLLKRLADMTQKYKDASLDNKNLTVDIETMRRKVNIAEEAVRRLTGTTLMLSTAFDKPASSTPLSSCASDAASASVAIEDSMKHFLQAPLQSGQMKLDIPNAAIPLTSMVIGTKPASLQRVASLENLQKRIIGDSMHSETASTFSGPEAFADR
ncbi:light-inducible protein CPRF2-like isoform X4 [Miscanthus floridulus]|uniref:light-inducible protein CPRF2-like isoform X4 n=1 Tax=Miscanthus floridulus TaxID=154761 RepID=UPI00345B0953